MNYELSMVAKLVQVLEYKVESFVEADTCVDAGSVEIGEGFVEVAKGKLKDVCSFVADSVIELFGLLLDVCGCFQEFLTLFVHLLDVREDRLDQSRMFGEEFYIYFFPIFKHDFTVNEIHKLVAFNILIMEGILRHRL